MESDASNFAANAIGNMLGEMADKIAELEARIVAVETQAASDAEEHTHYHPPEGGAMRWVGGVGWAGPGIASAPAGLSEWYIEEISLMDDGSWEPKWIRRQE